MKPKLIRRTNAIIVVGLAMLMPSCGEFVRQGRSPSQIVIQALEGASGAQPDVFGGNVFSDVETLVERTVNGTQVQVPTIFGDIGRVTMSLVLKDPGQPGLAATPSPLNSVTITRYRVTYVRSDGRNTPGVDVPFPFDGGVTFTIPSEGTVTAGFNLVRQGAKTEAPLLALAVNFNQISTVTTITFYGHDQAGNEVSVQGTMGIDFANFGDPE